MNYWRWYSRKGGIIKSAYYIRVRTIKGRKRNGKQENWIAYVYCPQKRKYITFD